jgi:hypothetical protein
LEVITFESDSYSPLAKQIVNPDHNSEFLISLESRGTML